MKKLAILAAAVVGYVLAERQGRKHDVGRTSPAPLRPEFRPVESDPFISVVPDAPAQGAEESETAPGATETEVIAEVSDAVDTDSALPVHDEADAGADTSVSEGETSSEEGSFGAGIGVAGVAAAVTPAIDLPGTEFQAEESQADPERSNESLESVEHPEDVIVADDPKPLEEPATVAAEEPEVEPELTQEDVRDAELEAELEAELDAEPEVEPIVEEFLAPPVVTQAPEETTVPEAPGISDSASSEEVALGESWGSDWVDDMPSPTDDSTSETEQETEAEAAEVAASEEAVDVDKAAETTAEAPDPAPTWEEDWEAAWADDMPIIDAIAEPETDPAGSETGGEPAVDESTVEPAPKLSEIAEGIVERVQTAADLAQESEPVIEDDEDDIAEAVAEPTPVAGGLSAFVVPTAEDFADEVFENEVPDSRPIFHNSNDETAEADPVAVDEVVLGETELMGAITDEELGKE